MRVIEIKYTHTVPKKQFESETLSLTAMIDTYDDPNKAIEILKETVDKGLGIAVKEKTPTIKEKKVVEKKESTAPTETKQEVKAPKKVAAAKDTEVKKAPKKEPKKKAPKKPKFIAYDRTDDNHKKELGTYLNENFKGWESDTSKAAKVSQEMTENQTPLYDKEGEIMQEFKDFVAKGMK